MSKIKDFLIDWVWQLPQHLIGILYKELSGSIRITYKPSYMGRHPKLYFKVSRGGVTFGNYIFVCYKSKNLPFLVRHESGHVKQSRMLGPLYLLVIGIPSITWAAIHTLFSLKKDYYWFYTESWANKLAGIQYVE